MKDPRYPDSPEQPAAQDPVAPDATSAAPADSFQRADSIPPSGSSTAINPEGAGDVPPAGSETASVSSPGVEAEPLAGAGAAGAGEPPVTTPIPPPLDRSPQRSPMAGIAAILSLLALAGAAWIWFSDQREQHLWAQQQASLSSHVETQGQSLAELREMLERAQAESRALQESVTRQSAQLQGDMQREFLKAEERERQETRLLNERLDDHQRRLVALSASNREHWLLAEAVYLLRLANQRVLIEGTPENAATLILSADELVRQAAQDSGSAELQALRRQLASDIDALNSVEAVDREGLYARLQALNERLQVLPASSVARFESTDVDQPPPAAAPELSWTQKAWAELKSMVGVVDQYFRIQDAQTPTEPLADQAALRLVRLHAGLLLEQAQIALLKADSRIWQETLAKAAAALEKHYQPSAEVAEFRRSLEELQQTEIAPGSPDISVSLQKLMTYIQDLERRSGAPGVAL